MRRGRKLTVLGLLGLCLGQVPSIQVLRVDLGRALWFRGSSAGVWGTVGSEWK